MQDTESLRREIAVKENPSSNLHFLFFVHYQELLFFFVFFFVLFFLFTLQTTVIFKMPDDFVTGGSTSLEYI